MTMAVSVIEAEQHELNREMREIVRELTQRRDDALTDAIEKAMSC